MCRCVSIMPGMMMPSLASISIVPSGTASRGPTAVTVSPEMSTSAPGSTDRASSMTRTVPPRRTMGRPASKSAGSPMALAPLRQACLTRVSRPWSVGPGQPAPVNRPDNCPASGHGRWVSPFPIAGRGVNTGRRPLRVLVPAGGAEERQAVITQVDRLDVVVRPGSQLLGHPGGDLLAETSLAGGAGNDRP